MLNRIRRFFESLVYAGLKPSGGVPPEPESPRRPGKLRDKIELFFYGGRPSDPLYLTNRTWKQKLRAPLLIGIPTVVVFIALALVFTNVYSPKTAPPKQPTPAELMANLLPDLQKTVHINTYTDAEITALRVVRGEGPPKVSGTLKNKTDRVISVELDVDLADVNGSRVGSLTERVSKAQPNGVTQFEFPAGNSAAVYALVRKMRPVE
jgi:hypothetical protein